MTPKLQRIIDRTDKALSKALSIVLTEIEREAKAAIKASPTLESFSIEGGTVAFNLAGGQSLAPSDINDNHADNIAGMLREYNGLFLITTLHPMVIKRDASGELVKFKVVNP